MQPFSIDPIIIGYKMQWKRNPQLANEYKDFHLVFPNCYHEYRQDGFGCSSLSPMKVGPIIHGQPGLPPSYNLENFHQANKVFPNEFDTKSDEILPIFFQTQLNMYNDPKPHRHKQRGVIPLFSIWVTPEGQQKRMTYFESRQLYCRFYEHGVKNNLQLQQLKDMLKEGKKLCICGYDMVTGPLKKSLDDYYHDESRPFGHEMVLYTLLTVSDPAEYPWRKFGQEPIPVLD